MTSKHANASVEWNQSTKGTARRINRRTILKSIVAGGSFAATGLAAPGFLRAQTNELTLWSTQGSEEQKSAYAKILEDFKRTNPEYTVNIQILTEEEILAKLSAAQAAGSPPSVINHIPPEYLVQLDNQKLVEPLDDVVKALGEQDFVPYTLELLKNTEEGYFPGLVFGAASTSGPLWYRKDLLAASGQAIPTGWDDFIAVAAAMTKDGIYGTIYPFGKTSMGDKMFVQTIWQAGGNIVDPNLDIAFNSPAVVRALEFVKEIVKSSPPNSSSYGYGETINGFVQGRAASAPYAGRVMTNVRAQNPSIADSVSVIGYPNPPDGRRQYTGDYDSVLIPKGTANLEGAKALVLALYAKQNYITFMHAVPGHLLPVLKSVAESPEYLDNPLLQAYPSEIETLKRITADSRSLLKEDSDHKLNKKAGEIAGSGVLIETLQDVVIGGVPAKDAAAKGADKIASILKS